MAREPQFALDLGTAPLAPARPQLPASIANGDPFPPGPYSVGLTYWLGGDGESHQGIPYTVRCGDGRCVAGHVPSLDCAEAIALALNTVFPVMTT